MHAMQHSGVTNRLFSDRCGFSASFYHDIIVRHPVMGSEA